MTRTVPADASSPASAPSCSRSALGASELRDLCLAPSAVRAAGITINHPQLRDLVLPLGRGHVLYPRTYNVEEQRWRSGGDSDWEEEEGTDGPGVDSAGSAPAATAAGGTQQQERADGTRPLFHLNFTPTCLTTNGSIVACGGQKGELYMRDLPSLGVRSSVPVKPFVLNMTLPSHSINNAITILPSWPGGWTACQAAFKRQHAGYVRERDRERERERERDRGRMDDDDDDDGDDYASGESDSDSSDGMDVDDDPPISAATYPNSLPFGHAPRIPPPGRARRHSTRSGSSTSAGVQYVSSHTQGDPRDRDGRGGAKSPAARRTDEPRILVSNNDMTVKMFALRHNVERAWDPADPVVSAIRTNAPVASTPPHYEPSRRIPGAERYFRTFEAMANAGAISTPINGPPSRFGWNFYERTAPPPATDPNTNTDSSTPLQRRWEDELALHDARYLGESVGAYRTRNPDGEAAAEARVVRENQLRQQRAAERTAAFERRIGVRADESHQARKLSRVGGTKFKIPVNHSSLSPDLRTMVTVGDSTDVFLYEVIDGGREFRKIGVYNAATDSGFSTAWSKDGRKFAVASQDGQVTVWDHRSSRPLALFYSSPSDMSTRDDESPRPVIDMSSSSGREAARVVKFSPEGSNRDLLVFTEEYSNIHIIDARTFHTHVVVPVPYDPPGSTPAPRRAPRSGPENKIWGLSGVAFDPTGDWLYAGTERTVVEWDMRRCGGGEGGTWSMA